ncbi:peptide ABC transporter ATP-binding protein [Brenneria roseae subsp. americana]|uniref:ABC-type dipeptide transporter n=1 Tax=Brenneria roseae subsp. americana TaxID=1508507 RepID=A0A2U1TYD1_9GAMM|nr:ABC transporter ATP-binding protein [Brenneria roseae]PWC14394.1 peptide ABC transporter ATP-binding protein [Brenneria roseae subsp. americana]
MMSETPLLSVKDLTVTFAAQSDLLHPVRGLSFEVERHETLGIIGESGCGKSVTAEALMGLLPERYCRVGGEACLNGQPLLSPSNDVRRRLRGNALAMIFQDPLSSLNPVYTIGFQIEESLRQHTLLSRQARKARVLELLAQVGMPDPPGCAAAYPHRLSGGMRQRVMIAIAIACGPALLIADEPTTALDVTIQAQILALLEQLKTETDMGIMLITHDLSVVAQMCQRVIVMYLGEIVEQADVFTLFDDARHPYTQALLRAVPNLNASRKGELPEIAGSVPPLTRTPVGCGFAPRCPLADARCHTTPPVLSGTDKPGHLVRCWKADSIGGPS